MTTSGSSIIDAKTVVPTGIATVSPTPSGKASCGGCESQQTRLATTGTSYPNDSAVKDAGSLEMAIVREHLARKGLGLHNDLQNESSIVGNLVTVLMMEKYGSPAQQAEWIPKMLGGTARIGFGLTEPLHGSDATWMETTATRDGDEWVISGEKYWNTGLHHATHDYIFARTSGSPGDGRGITCFIVPTDSPGFKIEEFMWTFNMPTDHAHVKLNEVRVHNDTILGDEGLGLMTAQLFVHENRIRQAASSLGAGLHCIDTAVAYANQRTVFGKTLSTNQAIQFPLAELATEAEMLRALIWKTAWQLDSGVESHGDHRQGRHV